MTEPRECTCPSCGGKNVHYVPADDSVRTKTCLVMCGDCSHQWWSSNRLMWYEACPEDAPPNWESTAPNPLLKAPPTHGTEPEGEEMHQCLDTDALKMECYPEEYTPTPPETGLVEPVTTLCCPVCDFSVGGSDMKQTRAEYDATHVCGTETPAPTEPKPGGEEESVSARPHASKPSPKRWRG